MSEHDYVISDQSGSSFLSDLNGVLAAIVSNNSKATAPTATFAYQFWADTTSGLLKIRNAANSAWIDIGTIATTNLGLALVAGSTGQTFSVAAATAVAHALRADQAQLQSVTAFTTAGTSTAYTLTPTPALAALTTGHRFRVKFNQTAGATPTLAISGLTAKSLKLYDSTGAKVSASATTIIANMLTDVEYDGTDYVILDPLPVAFATDAETRTGTSTVLTINPANIKATQLGWGQTWQDVSASRTPGTTYTNTTGRPIVVFTSASGSGGTYSIDGVVSGYQNGTSIVPNTMIIPNNSTYRLDGLAIYSNCWFELR